MVLIQDTSIHKWSDLKPCKTLNQVGPYWTSCYVDLQEPDRVIRLNMVGCFKVVKPWTQEADCHSQKAYDEARPR